MKPRPDAMRPRPESVRPSPNDLASRPHGPRGLNIPAKVKPRSTVLEVRTKISLRLNASSVICPKLCQVIKKLGLVLQSDVY